MRNRKMKSKKSRINAKGITLIALVITIIVLLILAGVSIATLTGENGILTRAQEAKTKTEEAEDIEKIRLAMSEAQIGENRYQELDATNFQEALNSQFEGRNIQLSDNGDGSYTISLDNNSKMFYADSDGQIISNENMIEISTAEELKAFRDDVNAGNTYEGKYVYLTNDISLDINEEWTPIGIYLNDVTTPDDERNKPFKGIFDGGNYEINVDSGNYILVFTYDTDRYILTDYKKAGIDESQNSDVISRNVTIDGTNSTLGATDVISVNSGNITNIDIGLIEASTFDLELDKYVSEVIVQTNRSTTQYGYNDQNLVKVEIPARELNNATVIIRYTIKITNVGEVAGYVQNIVDYIPSDLSFSSELNSDWYQVNANLQNNSYFCKLCRII